MSTLGVPVALVKPITAAALFAEKELKLKKSTKPKKTKKSKTPKKPKKLSEKKKVPHVVRFPWE